MHDEPTGVRAALQSPERKRCPACQQVKHRADFCTTPAGLPPTARTASVPARG
jgi:hypothetical protein